MYLRKSLVELAYLFLLLSIFLLLEVLFKLLLIEDFELRHICSHCSNKLFHKNWRDNKPSHTPRWECFKVKNLLRVFSCWNLHLEKQKSKKTCAVGYHCLVCKNTNNIFRT